MLGSNGFPHSMTITRVEFSDIPPYAELPESQIWSGECSCQAGNTEIKQFVSNSTHIVFFEFIDDEIKEGDAVSIVKKDGHTPIIGVVIQSESVDVFEDEGKKYGTTLWIKETKN